MCGSKNGGFRVAYGVESKMLVLEKLFYFFGLLVCWEYDLVIEILRL